jgi:hypothetical protein
MDLERSVTLLIDDDSSTMPRGPHPRLPERERLPPSHDRPPFCSGFLDFAAHGLSGRGASWVNSRTQPSVGIRNWRPGS